MAKTRLKSPSYSVVTVGVASTALIALNKSRDTLGLLNLGDAVVWIAINGGTPVVNASIPCYPGILLMITPEMYSDGAVNGIVAASTQNVAVLENIPDMHVAGPITLGAGTAAIGTVTTVDEFGVSQRPVPVLEEIANELAKIRAYLSHILGEELVVGDGEPE